MRLLITLACIAAVAQALPVSKEEETREGELQARGHGAPEFLHFSCAGRQDGFFADLLRGCHQYYLCRAGEVTTYFCQDHRMLFNQQLRACVHADTYICPAMEKRRLQEEGEHPDRPDELNFSCVDRTNGYYADTARRCHVFYYCLNGQKNQFNCVSGTLFDTKLNVCNWEASVQCPRIETYREAVKPDMEVADDFLNRLKSLLREIKEKKLGE